MVMTEPENFALTVSATPEEIRNVIVAGLAHDVDLGFHLLPDTADTAQGSVVKLFPPEYGESVKEFWIWFVRCSSFFPGPAWMLGESGERRRSLPLRLSVRRQGPGIQGAEQQPDGGAFLKAEAPVRTGKNEPSGR
jgi:hypothetical protein